MAPPGRAPGHAGGVGDDVGGLGRDGVVGLRRPSRSLAAAAWSAAPAARATSLGRLDGRLPGPRRTRPRRPPARRRSARPRPRRPPRRRRVTSGIDLDVGGRQPPGRPRGRPPPGPGQRAATSRGCDLSSMPPRSSEGAASASASGLGPARPTTSPQPVMPRQPLLRRTGVLGRHPLGGDRRHLFVPGRHRRESRKGRRRPRRVRPARLPGPGPRRVGLALTGSRSPAGPPAPPGSRWRPGRRACDDPDARGPCPAPSFDDGGRDEAEAHPVEHKDQRHIGLLENGTHELRRALGGDRAPDPPTPARADHRAGWSRGRR